MRQLKHVGEGIYWNHEQHYDEDKNFPSDIDLETDEEDRLCPIFGTAMM
jgi:hypothetical protein